MLFLLSPAKSLDYHTPAGDVLHTLPQFVPQATELIDILRQKSPQDIAELMGLSDALSGLNVARYQAWRPKFTAKNAKQAVLAFNGDVYGGLQAKTLDVKALDWLQAHVCILSGLYGVLRPLDYMQPYRLEMGTPLRNAHGKNLYAFWGTQIAEHLNTRLQKDASPVVVNLATDDFRIRYTVGNDATNIGANNGISSIAISGNVVPEPCTALLGGWAGLALLGRRRR